jgi:hypothetical protein
MRKECVEKKQMLNWMKRFLVFIGLFFAMVSCVDIVDDIYIKSDGTGTFKYSVNLSASKVKVNSILALDSLDGRKVPSIPEIKEKINHYKEIFSQKDGISNVKVESDFTNFIFRFQCDFASVTHLQNALKELVLEESKNKNFKDLETNWLVLEMNRLTRSVPSMTTDFTSKLKKEDAEALKTGKYLCISRFEKLVEKVENPAALISPNKQAVMIKTTPYALIQNLKLLENTIYLTENKKP